MFKRTWDVTVREKLAVSYFLCGEGETLKDSHPSGMPSPPETSNTWRMTSSFIVQLLIVPSDLPAGSETPNLEKGEGGERRLGNNHPQEGVRS